MANSISPISLPQYSLISSRKPWLKSSCLILHNNSSNHRPLSSSSPSPVETVDNDDDLTFSGCRGCGKEEKESGCNGNGRIQGGIATVPGFGWWPIKAYRPCPAFVEAGGRYRRIGQSMDEVVSGRNDSGSSSSSTIDSKSKKLAKVVADSSKGKIVKS